MKKLLSILLALSLIFTLSAPTFASLDEAEKCDCGNPPIVYVVGRADVYVDPNAEVKVDAVHAEDGAILEAVKDVMPIFAKAVITDQWDEYCDALVGAVAPFFEDYTLDNEGNVKNTSGIVQTWSEDEIYDAHYRDSVHDYTFFYDPRLDPWEIADDLNRYIERIEEVTGHDSVCLLSRCMGSSIALTYLIKYAKANDYKDINNFVIFNGTLNGFSVMDEAFTGKLALNCDGIERYASDLLGTDVLSEFLKATITLFNKTQVLDLAADAIENIYAKIYTNVVPKILIETYGGIPGYWTMIGEDSYEEAKSFVFGGREEEFPVLLEKLDNFHNKVRTQIVPTLMEMQSKDIPISIVCKYGLQLAPIVESSHVQSDNTFDLYQQSFGATSVALDTPLSDEYLKNAEANGTAKYISPDKEIDASTGLFPDSTWYIKDLPHFSFPLGVDQLLIDLCRYEGGMKITSDERYPQYLHYDLQSDSISPLTEENYGSRYEKSNIFTAIINFFKTLTALLADYIKGAFNK